jgi:hypothetical protein
MILFGVGLATPPIVTPVRRLAMIEVIPKGKIARSAAVCSTALYPFPKE